ncbi:MAG: hypothetical protein M3Y59_13410 [Myxococcota bacterium]|nr:hypothetical protein [Myxococcota bacterium]
MTVLVALVAIPSATAWYRAREIRRSTAQDFVFDLSLGEEGWRELPSARQEQEEEGVHGDDPRRRMIANRAQFGRWTNEARAQHMRIAEQEALRWQGRYTPVRPAPGVAPAPGDFGENWINLGPTDAAFQWNGSTYLEVDSGRITGIAVHPADLSTVYLSLSGGGVWKATDFGEVLDATWVDKGLSLGNQALGAIALDPSAPDTVYIGTGDPFDTEGGQVLKSTDGADSWGPAVTLAGTSPGGTAVGVRSIREILVDPNNGAQVLVGSDVGLFRSTNGGDSFSLVDLPNPGTGTLEAIWSVVHLGGTRFLVSGVQGCDASRLPPSPGGGVEEGGALAVGTCVGGNPGDVWLSTDGGISWTSRRAQGALPGPVRPGRMTLTAAPQADPATSTVYAMVASEDDSSQLGIWRSDDGGNTFVAASGSLSNETRDCNNPRVAGAQAWYNHAMAVDPGNPAHVLSGGMLCAVRTTSGKSGTPTWENVAHWLPTGGGGATGGVDLPYVHADWHKAVAVRVGGTLRVLAGTDGGIYFSDNLFGGLFSDVRWQGVNRGLATHLVYSIASGDPATGDALVAFGGLQDNGTRLRDTSVGNGSTFNQVIGGDGIGAAARRVKNGLTRYFASVNGSRNYCDPSDLASCDGGEWTATDPTRVNCPDNSDPFFIRYAALTTRPFERAVLSASNRTVLRAVEGPRGPVWETISACLSSPERTHIIREVDASAVYDGVYGAPLSGGRFAVTSDCVAGKTDCAWTVSSRVGLDLDGNGTLETSEKLLYSNAMDFPPGPTGKPLGDVYVAVSGAPVTEAEGTVPAALGHVFLTQDRGTTFQKLSGDLPNVPAHVVRYDPADKTNQTIYVGTDLGLYRTTNGGTNWALMGQGLPMVRVTDLFISQSGGMIRAATYGRGFWEIHPGATARVQAGDKDGDGNGQIDFFDLAAAASGLGQTPSSDTRPYYEWRLDSTSLGALDDGDLSAVISSLGNDS